jgi:hypothetical protein
LDFHGIPGRRRPGVAGGSKTRNLQSAFRWFKLGRILTLGFLCERGGVHHAGSQIRIPGNVQGMSVNIETQDGFHGYV